MALFGALKVRIDFLEKKDHLEQGLRSEAYSELEYL